MSLIETITGALPRAKIRTFGGAATFLEASDIPQDKSRIARNCEFAPGRVQTRRGFAQVWNPNKPIRGMHYWQEGLSGSFIDWLTYMTDEGGGNSNLILRLTNTGVETTLKSTISGASGFIQASVGSRAFFAILDSNALAINGGYVYDGSVGDVPIGAPFQRPLVTTEVSISVTQPATGVITKGTHLVLAIAQTRDGYWTQPFPVVAGSDPSPASFVASGNKNARFTFTPSGNWPDWIRAIQILLTPAANNFQYYIVPNTITNVLFGTSVPCVVTVNLGDIELRGTDNGNAADDYFDLLSQNSSGGAPFGVKNVCVYGDRVVWAGWFGGMDCFFPSEPGTQQWITASQHVKSLPNGAPIGAMFSQQGGLYILSPAGKFYGYIDDGSKPVAWGKEQEIDNAIGTNAPKGVAGNSTGTRTLIATPQGLYAFFGATLPDIPLSYYQDNDWKQIDWQSPMEIVLKDYSTSHLAVLRCKWTDGSYKVMCWSYHRGLTPEKIDYTLWTVPGSGPIEIVRHPTKKIWELYVASRTAGKVYRHKSLQAGDSSLYNDDSMGIDCEWRGPMVPEDANGFIQQFVAVGSRVQGNGILTITAYGLDDTRLVTLAPVTLGLNPGKWSYRFPDLKTPSASFGYSNGSVADSYFILSAIDLHYDQFAVSEY